MRLVLALVLVFLAGLDYRFGKGSAVLELAALVAGILLGASLFLDRLLPGEGESEDGTDRPAEAASAPVGQPAAEPID